MRKKAIDICGGTAIALFIFAGRMLKVGRTDEGDWQTSFWLTLFAFALAIAIIPMISLASGELFAKKRGVIDRVLTAAVGITVLIAAIFIALKLTDESAEFVTRSMDIGASNITAAVLLLALGGYMAGLERKTLKKFALVTYVFAILSSGVLLVISLCRGGLTDSDIFSVLSWKAVKEAASAKAILSRFFDVIAPSVIAVVWLGEDIPRKRGALSVLSGLLMGGGGLLICYISTEAVLGMEYASPKAYPYLSAVGSMTAGKLFFRPEGFVYLSYLWGTVLAVSICISLACRLIDRQGKMKKRLSFFVAAFSFAAYLMFFAKML